MSEQSTADQQPSQPDPPPVTWKSRPVIDSLLSKIAAGAVSPVELADELGIPLAELDDLARHDNIVRGLLGLCRIGELRAQACVSKHRADVAHKLLHIALREKDDETTRRACSELLKINFNAFDHLNHDAHSRPPVYDEETLRRILHEHDEPSS